MTSIRRFDYSSDKQITTQYLDEINNFLWVAFAQDNNGNCIIEKQAFADPLQTYFSLNRAVNNVNQMDSDGTNIYVAYDDATLFGEIINQNTPLSVQTDILKGAIVESPIDVKIDTLTLDLWFLLPGNASGTNAQLLRYDTSGILQQTVDLNKSGGFIVNNAKSMTIDANSDICIGSFETPARIVREFQISGGLYDFTIDETLIA